VNHNKSLLTPEIIADLDTIHNQSLDHLVQITNTPMLITGASGFIGTWLSLSWIYSRKQLAGQGHLIATSRQPEKLSKLVKILDPNAPITFLKSDIRTVSLPGSLRDGFVVHAATPASAQLNELNPNEMLSTIIDGQKQILSESVNVGIRRLLFTSSGAVYGNQPFDQVTIEENWNGAPDILNPRSAYHEGKRVAELMGVITSGESNLAFISARLFAFIAPFMPTDAHFAATNFIDDAVSGRPIVIKSGGGSVRSYQYGTDMISALWMLLIRGSSGLAYNVGSDVEISIRGLAERIRELVNPSVEVTVQGMDDTNNLSRYVPSLRMIRDEFNFENKVDLDRAIIKTSQWIRTQKGN